MSLWSRLFSSGAKKARAEALRRGIEVVEVQRDAPVFHRFSTRFEHLERLSTVCYSVPRTRPGLPRRWSFLQRDKATGAQYPHGWMYSSLDGPPPEALQAVLAAIATDWTEEYLEFEADDGAVKAFWEEWGGVELVATIDNWLRQLEAACAAA